MNGFSQEIKDFLIVAIILFIGGWGFLKWQEMNPPEPREVKEKIALADQKIICKVDRNLKDFVKCSKNGDLIEFYLDKAKSKKLFDIETQVLLDECDNRECKKLEITEDLKNYAEDSSLKTISVVIPQLLEESLLQGMVTQIFAKNPPRIGDTIKVQFLSHPESVFVAEYAFFDIRADIINFRRNKNKVIRIFAGPKKDKREKDFSFAEKELFYSAADFETKWQAFLTEKRLTSGSKKDLTISNAFFEATQVVPEEERKTIVIFVLDKNIQYPKARYYELNAEDYDKFLRNQRYYNRKVTEENAACEANEREDCEIKLLWTESFAQYYIRRTKDEIIDSLDAALPEGAVEIQFVSAERSEKDAFQAQKESIIDELETLLKNKIIKSTE